MSVPHTQVGYSNSYLLKGRGTYDKETEQEWAGVRTVVGKHESSSPSGGLHDLLMVGIEEERMGYDDKSNGEEILPPTQSLPHSLCGVVDEGDGWWKSSINI